MKLLSRRLKMFSALQRAGIWAAQIELMGVVFSNLFTMGLLGSGRKTAVISSVLPSADELNTQLPHPKNNRPNEPR
ncbi:hypothetical protein [Pseudomonas sp. R4-35-07]|uniref:hypothetical protein n=1 Tax=Pseudomonas sp. R4-35-07 TaxID=658643 RepID=UPI0021155FD8|nr:hypothetical protein [Pseudomonas sp. R4-35-07]